MRWKTTLLLLVATIGLGAYISLYEIRQPLPEERARLTKRVLSLEPETAGQLALTMPLATVTLAKTETGWVVRLSPGTPPDGGVRADPSRIDRLLGQLASLTAERVLSPRPDHPLDLHAFGLDPAVGQLTVAGSGTSHTLLFGEATPVADNRYAKLADRPEVFVLSSALFNDVNQPRERFRDPLLIRVGEWTLNTVSVTSSATTYTLTRANQRWQLGPPINDEADRAALSTMLHQLSEIMIKRFVNDAPQADQLAAWGFDYPSAEVRLEQGDPSAAVTLVFGKPLPDDPSLVYAKRSDETAVYAVALTDLEPLLASPQTLRSMSPFEFFTNTVTRVELKEGDATRWTIERQEGRWRAEGSASPLDAQPVDVFLDQLADLQVSGFVDAPSTDLARYGLRPSAGVISVWTLNTEQPQSLTIGAAVEGSAERYGQIDGRAVIVKLPGTVADLLATTLDRFRSPATQPPDRSAQ